MRRLLSKHDSLVKYSVLALLLVIPLYPKFPLFGFSNIQVSIRIEDILVFSVVIVWAISVLKDKLSFVRNPITLGFILFFVVGILSLFSAVTLTKTISLSTGILHLARRAEYMVCFFIGWEAMRNKSALPLYIRTLLVIVFVTFVVGIGQKYFSWPVITTQNSEYAKGIALRYMPGGHLVTTFAGHYDMANYMVFISPILIALMFSKHQVISKVFGTRVMLSRTALAVALLVLYWLIVNSASRMPIVAFMMSSSLILFLLQKKKFIPVLLAISILMTGLSSNLIARYMSIFNATFKRAEEVVIHTAYAQTASQPEDRSTSIRTNVEWPRAIRALEKNPLLGTGYSSITLATDNDYLRMLGETGLLGLLSFILLGMQIAIRLFGKIKIPLPREYDLDSLFIAAIIAAIPAILLNMVFIDILEASKFAISFWLFLGFAFGTSYAHKN